VTALPWTALAATLLALVHVLSPRLTMLDAIPRSRWLSAAGGVSTAYVFVHLLPELARYQVELFETSGAEVFLIALAGLTTFYGLERWIKSHDAADDRRRELPRGSFRLHLGAFAAYNLLIGYLLPERIEDDGADGLAIYTFAMAVHFVVNDRGLYAHHGPRYVREGRWILAAAPFAGLALGTVTELSGHLVAGLLAFLGGSVILNVLKEELPEERRSRFPAFALGAAAYAAVLFFFL
jgi:hypothetical protein